MLITMFDYTFSLVHATARSEPVEEVTVSENSNQYQAMGGHVDSNAVRYKD